MKGNPVMRTVDVCAFVAWGLNCSVMAGIFTETRSPILLAFAVFSLSGLVFTATATICAAILRHKGDPNGF